MSTNQPARLERNSLAFNKELIAINKFRREMGLKELVLKKRKCLRCSSEFETIVGYQSNFTCGCLTYISKGDV